jgi:hypothetical protein
MVVATNKELSFRDRGSLTGKSLLQERQSSAFRKMKAVERKLRLWNEGNLNV